MWSRRKFLTAGAAVSTAAVAPFTSVAAILNDLDGGSAAKGNYYALVDESIPASRVLGAVVAEPARIARNALVMRWPELQRAMPSHGAIFGLTRYSDIAIVMQLVAQHGARLAYANVTAGDRAQYMSEQNIEQLPWLTKMLEVVNEQGCTVPGNLPTACRSMNLHRTAEANNDGLVAWTIVYGNA